MSNEATGPDAAAGGFDKTFRSLFEHAPVGIYQSTTGRLLRVNLVLAKMFGFKDPAEMLNDFSDPAGFYADPGQRSQLQQQALESESFIHSEVLCRRQDGSTFFAKLSITAVGKSEGAGLFEGFVEDITERRQLEEEIRQAQKMQTIGLLAGSIAHDFNNIVAATLMHLGQMQHSPQLAVGMKNLVKDIENDLATAAHLTRHLLLFSRRQEARFQAVDLNLLIQDLLPIIDRFMGSGIEVTFQAAALAPWVKADPIMIEQAIVNLCVNARDTMSSAGKLTLTIKREDQGPELARPGRFICLEIADTGGADFNVTEIGKVAGIAVVHDIVKQHQGWIEMEDRFNQGASCRIFFPAAADPKEKNSAEDPSEELVCGSETILLVDDDLTLRRPMALCLRKLGYGVLEAANAREALKLWESRQQKIELLLTDLVMPEAMNGLDLAGQLRAKEPGLHVIVSSGDSDEVEKPRPSDMGVMFLAKPFNPTTLAKTVRQCLDRT